MSSRYSTVVCHMMEPKRLYISLGYIGRHMKCILCYSVRVVWDSHSCWKPLCCSFVLCLWPLPSADAPAVGGSWKGQLERAGLWLGFPLFLFCEISTQFPSSLCSVAPQACAGVGRGRELLLQLFQFTAARYNVF